MVSIGALFAGTEVGAQPTTCLGGQYTVTFNGRASATPTTGQATWTYTIQASQTALSAVKGATMIVPRPVAPRNILSPSPFTYCVAADNNTKINTGNCNGFPLNITTLTKSGSNLTFQVITSDNVTTDVVSMNVVTGASSSQVCVAALDANNDPTGGIAGPGKLGDLTQIFQTARTFQRTNSQGTKCTTTFTLDTSGNVVPPVTKICGTTQTTVTGIPFSQIIVDIGNGPEQLRQVGKDGDFVEVLTGQDSSCSVYYRGTWYQIC